MKDKVGEIFTCIVSKSNFYKSGKEYPLVEKDGKLGFIGEDGMFDPKGKTASQFIKGRANAIRT